MMKYELEQTAITNIGKVGNMKTNRTENKKESVMALFNNIKESRVDHYGYDFAEGEVDKWFNLIQMFRAKVATDQSKLTKHEVAGRAILYSQLADAYEIGLELVTDDNLKALNWLAAHHNMAEATKMISIIKQNMVNVELNLKCPDKEQREIKKQISPWVYVVKLLYGKWFDTTAMTDVEKQAFAKKIGAGSDLAQFAPILEPADEPATVYQEWKPNRSAEKYAVVFRYLHDNEVAAEDVASFIENFNHETYGKRLLGIERAGRAAVSQGKPAKAPSQAVIDKRNDYVARAEARKNWNVFAVEKPNTFPSKFTYARAVLKQEGDELVIILIDGPDTPMDEGAYINQAIRLGKPLLDAEIKRDAERQADIEAAKPAAMGAIDRKLIGDHIAALVADGDDAAEINAEFQALLDKRAAKLAASKALEGFADADPT